MKKFMVFIYPQGESIFNLPEESQQKHMQKVGAYLGELKENGLLLDAQPLQPFGTILSGNKATLTVEAIDQANIAGFYTLQANDLETLIATLKNDPRFEDASWQLEIREILEMM
ncbi:MAG: YciI family protein [Reichenbachiella sp.]|uniref:YciI family protein n=1 Tax=Reichenbachiella sp. TaxID=2184521 RepID=UPI003298A7E1